MALEIGRAGLEADDVRLLQAIQGTCGFEPGELRIITVESQPMGGRSHAWTIADAATGVLEQGETEVEPLTELQPWPAPG